MKTNWMDQILPRTQLDMSGKTGGGNANPHEIDFESCLNCEHDSDTKFDASANKPEASSNRPDSKSPKNGKTQKELATKYAQVDFFAFSFEQSTQNLKKAEDADPSVVVAGLPQASLGILTEQESGFAATGLKLSAIQLKEGALAGNGKTEFGMPSSSGPTKTAEGKQTEASVSELKPQLAELSQGFDPLDSNGKQTPAEVRNAREATSVVEMELKRTIDVNDKRDKSIELDGKSEKLSSAMSDAFEPGSGQEGSLTQQDLGRAHDTGSGTAQDSVQFEGGTRIDFFRLLEQGASGLGQFDNNRSVEPNEPQISSFDFPNSQVAETSKLVISQLIEPLSGMEFSDLPGGDRELSIQIHPAELGQLEVRVTGSDDGMLAEIIATEYITSELLNREKLHLIEALNEKGLFFPNLDISYRDSNDRRSAGSMYEELDDGPKPVESEKTNQKTSSKHTSSNSLIDVLV